MCVCMYVRARACVAICVRQRHKVRGGDERKTMIGRKRKNLIAQMDGTIVGWKGRGMEKKVSKQTRGIERVTLYVCMCVCVCVE